MVHEFGHNMGLSHNFTWQGGSIPTISDQVTINSGHTVTIPASTTVSAGTLFDKGVLKNFGTLSLGTSAPSTSAGTLQTLDYKYQIRGELKGINTDVNNDLTNNLFSYKLSYETAGFYDGNIGKQEWKSNIDNKERAYTFGYDGSSRLKSGIYVSTQAGENYSLNNVDHDANGNITALSRSGATNNNYTAFGNVDNLTYTYQSNSNKLSKIQDGTSGNVDLGDFRDGTNTGDDYDYWADGSLKKDRNKGIDSLKYNYLKLTERIKFTGGRAINNEYDANGTKLKKVDSNGETTDYEEDDIYVNGILYQTSHDEGRIANGVYEYNINDHLGNLRVAFRDSVGIAVPTQSIFYDPFGQELRGLSFERNPATKNNFKFLGRESQAETGLIDLINRQYDPVIGRFTSPDPVTDGQEHLSLYQYGWNNPLLRSDPDGLYPDDGECCENLPTPTVSSDATNVARGTPVGLNMKGGQATPAFGLTISVGKQIALEVGKFGGEVNMGSKEVLNATEMGTSSSSNTSVTTKGFSVSYGAGTIGAEKKVTTTQEAGALSTSIKGLTLKTSATITTENTSSMGGGVSPVAANLEGKKTSTSYVLSNGYTTAPTVTGRNTTATVGASAMPKKGWTSFSVGFGVKVEVKVDLKQAWENVKKYGL